MRLWTAGLSVLIVSFASWAFPACASSEDSGAEGGTGGGDSGTTGGTGGTGGTSGTGAGGATGGTGGATDGGTCTADEDCPDINLPFCNTANGSCVECLPTSDPCAAGYYCDATNKCSTGCTDDSDCDPTQSLHCDAATHSCVPCVTDSHCPAGEICTANKCVAGCNATQACPSGQSCCAGSCLDTKNDVKNCGTCGNACPDLANASEICVNGFCGLGACTLGYLDCNQNQADGCETAGTCTCSPGASQACYSGAPGTAGIGICKKGTQTCQSDGTWGTCLGQVLPAPEVCANQLDDDCNGTVDDSADADGDGWGTCNGDCCDSAGPACGNPALVNPGAFEVPGNSVDDDCDGTIDNPQPLCDTGLASNSSTALDYAKAIDLCKTTTENPPIAQKTWGVISAALQRADGTSTPNPSSRSIRDGFGSVIKSQLGQSLAVLSTGYAADKNDTNPEFKAFQDGQDMGTQSAFPVGYTVPAAPGCPKSVSTAAFDSAMLKLRVRVPTNAQSFQVKLYFFSAEYPEYVCTAFNDFFVSLIDSAATTNPPDKNIAIYSSGTSSWPVGVNLLKAASGLFEQCQNGPITFLNKSGKICGNPSGTYSGCLGTNELAGTGYDTTGTTPYSCGYAGMHGGGTSWLIVKGNVKPGETMEIRFALWDTADHLFDSLALLDAWEWKLTPSQPGVTWD